MDLRIFEIKENDKYLLRYPYQFKLSHYHLLFESGQCPKYNEVFLMVNIKQTKYRMNLLINGYLKMYSYDTYPMDILSIFIAYVDPVCYIYINS